jgi:cleavage and polyadenylation specificity factor subunit 2
MHVGALPFLAKNKVLGEKIVIMGTSPTSKMGALTMYEYYIQKKEIAPFDHFTLQDVETAFERIELVSFNEKRRIKVLDTELMLSALPSGNSIGGTAWKIEYNK